MINLRVTQLATLELLKEMIRISYPDQDARWVEQFRMNLIDQVQQLPHITVLNLMGPPVMKYAKQNSTTP